MRGWEIPHSNDNPDLTPMIDIVFLLIIFFMVVANIITADKIKLPLPIAHDAAIPENTGLREVISVTADGSIFIGATPASLDRVREVVAQNKTLSSHYKIFLRGDAGTPFKHLRDVMQACAEAGVIDIVFATYQSDK